MTHITSILNILVWNIKELESLSQQLISVTDRLCIFLPVTITNIVLMQLLKQWVLGCVLVGEGGGRGVEQQEHKLTTQSHSAVIYQAWSWLSPFLMKLHGAVLRQGGNFTFLLHVSNVKVVIFNNFSAKAANCKNQFHMTLVKKCLWNY